jgi:hypothetical protein
MTDSPRTLRDEFAISLCQGYADSKRHHARLHSVPGLEDALEDERLYAQLVWRLADALVAERDSEGGQQ